MAKEEGARSFGVFFSVLGQGDAEREATDKLHQLLEACRDEAHMRSGDAAGELTIKVKLKVDETGQVLAVHQITNKLPPPVRTKTMGWITKGANFTTSNPRQQALPLREVPSPAQVQVRDIDQAAEE